MMDSLREAADAIPTSGYYKSGSGKPDQTMETS
jgi:hypothetical protein